ncbi:MAG: hypothetical protein WBN41_16370 [Lysobacterales bacterium]
MKSLLQKAVAVPFFSTLLISLSVSQMFMLPLLADELVNITDIKGCRGIKSDIERLSCYDTVNDGGVFNEEKQREVRVEDFGSETMPKAPPPEPAPAPVSAPAPVTTTDSSSAPVSEPVAEVTPVQEAAPAAGKVISADELDVTIVRLKKGNGGIYYFQTSEGQVWKQQNAVSWNIKAPFDARIKRGLLNSFFLIHEGGKSTRIKRVK